MPSSMNNANFLKKKKIFKTQLLINHKTDNLKMDHTAYLTIYLCMNCTVYKPNWPAYLNLMINKEKGAKANTTKMQV